MLVSAAGRMKSQIPNCLRNRPMHCPPCFVSAGLFAERGGSEKNQQSKLTNPQ
jgi:hypothetical protein